MKINNGFIEIILEIITLRTARGRLFFALFAHIILMIIPYAWLQDLSLYKKIRVNSPSIGLTRAYWLILHGELIDAWQRNWMIFPVLAVGWSIVILDIYQIYLRIKRDSMINSL
jgi:hypothetical protein